jgi:Domain of unknown function (DUF4411)
MWTLDYRPAAFPSVWRVLSRAIEVGAAIAPREVYLELERSRNTEMFKWMKEHRVMFQPDTPELVAAVVALERDFPNLVEYDKEPYDADPWVIALAEMTGASVLTGEKETGTRVGGMTKPRLKIPDVCRARGIRLASVSDFIEARNAAL